MQSAGRVSQVDFFKAGGGSRCDVAVGARRKGKELTPLRPTRTPAAKRPSTPPLRRLTFKGPAACVAHIRGSSRPTPDQTRMSTL
ncbi:hypothetical protein SKAU_G00110760 [Synaphobranchus kaupii]|uniref:Uncharacterized protein n=1 Tax=Synaphobranchus kaupii TaxID=118154 RepID=A0A9Q1G085_SYNKA|nr:hypothetical protein SKAU_G00110760 [Synaphobranchus kaupii]